jgi:membrane-associated phospholipid phosphatase
MLPLAVAERGVAVGPQESKPQPSGRVHLALVGCSTVLLSFCLFAAPPGAMHSALPLIETVLLLTPPLLVPAAFLHEKKKWERRDAFLTLPWTLLVALLITQAAPTTATFAFPLRDRLWTKFDASLHINIPAMMAWALRHPEINKILTACYNWSLHPLVLAAIFLPALLGKRVAAQRFVLSNALSFVLALPFMLFLPAVGPWVGWHFTPNPLQQQCEATIHALRQGSLIIKDTFGGIVCLPSFHVFWAVVSAYALYPFRFLRYPAIVLALLISFSTMTTGWHYGVDVVAGFLLMLLCTYLANMVIEGRIYRPFSRGNSRNKLQM